MLLFYPAINTRLLPVEVIRIISVEHRVKARSPKHLCKVFIVLGAYIGAAGRKLPCDADGSLNPLFLCEFASTGEVMIDVAFEARRKAFSWLFVNT